MIGTALLSGLIAALASGSVQLLVRFLDVKSRRKDFYNARKVEEYFKALDAYMDLRESFESLGKAMLGRKDPNACENLAEKQRMIDRDHEGAEAIGNVNNALLVARRATARLSLLGSESAEEDFSKVRKVVTDYMERVIEDAKKDGRFRAATYSSAMSEFDAALGCLVENAKENLGL